MKFDLYFGELRLSIHAAFFQGQITERMKLFTRPTKGGYRNVTVYYEFISQLITVPEAAKLIWQDENMRVYRTGECDYRVFRYWGEEEDYAVVVDDRSNRIHGSVVPGKESYFPSTFHLQPLLLLDSVLVRNHALILHASNIIWNGRSILFFGPSGAGKSTQASLWAEYLPAEIINGDRAVLQKNGHEFQSYGISWCGSSDICKNKAAPVRALVLLKQAKENKVVRLNGFAACKAVLSEVTVASWNCYDKNLLLGQAIELVTEVPVLCYHCKADESAVRYLQTYLEEKWPCQEIQMNR